MSPWEKYRTVTEQNSVRIIKPRMCCVVCYEMEVVSRGCIKSVC